MKRISVCGVSSLVVVVAVVVVALVETTWAIHPTLSRWTRQVHCQAGDEVCKMCSTSCNTVEESRLPECCEAYNACCDQYFQACKKCTAVAAKDHFFPEYCCASFTDCCDVITTFKTSIKPPEVVRKEPKTELKIPSVAAPKPTSFPGSSSPAAASPFSTHNQPASHPSLTPQHTDFTSSHPPPSRVSPGQTSGSRVVLGNHRRGQSGARAQQRPQQAATQQRPRVSSRGRITSRGRVTK